MSRPNNYGVIYYRLTYRRLYFFSLKLPLDNLPSSQLLRALLRLSKIPARSAVASIDAAVSVAFIVLALARPFGALGELTALPRPLASGEGTRADNGSVSHGSWVKWVNKSGWITWVTGTIPLTS